MTIGSRLKLARLKRNLSQNQVADILEIHRTTIGKYENDECDPPLEKFMKMIDLYHADANYILFGDIPNELKLKNLPDILIQKIYILINEYYESLDINQNYKR